MTIQTFFLSLLVERKYEQDFTHYFNIPLGKKEVGNGENWSHKEKMIEYVFWTYGIYILIIWAIIKY